MNALHRILLLLGLLTLAAGCAKLPLDNEAPARPELVSDGTLTGYGVAVQVTVDDPDSDRVTVHFQANSTTGGTIDFAWTSFIASGQPEIFYLNLGLGQWTLTARARDEWEELSPSTTVDLLVQLP